MSIRETFGGCGSGGEWTFRAAVDVKCPIPPTAESWWMAKPDEKGRVRQMTREEFSKIAADELERRMRFVKYPALAAMDGVESVGDAGFVPKSSRLARRFVGAPPNVRLGAWASRDYSDAADE